MKSIAKHKQATNQPEDTPSAQTEVPKVLSFIEWTTQAHVRRLFLDIVPATSKPAQAKRHGLNKEKGEPSSKPWRQYMLEYVGIKSKTW